MKKVIRKKKFKIGDVTKSDYLLMKQAFFLSDKDTFVCFGPTFSKLNQLDLVDDENQLTYTGKALVKFLMSKIDQ